MMNLPSGSSMNLFRNVALVTLALVGWTACADAQGGGSFDPSAYATFLLKTRDLSAAGLAGVYPAGTFSQAAPCTPSQASYVGRVDSVYHLTTAERTLLSGHGFMVTERLTRPSFGAAYLDIYHADLPVFVSADAILHAYHMSYDAILMDVELQVLVPALDSLLQRVSEAVPGLAAHHAATPGMQGPLEDLDLYLTVARTLLGRTVVPYFTANVPRVAAIRSAVLAELPASIELFGTTPRTIDFSQFTPRGHYTEDPRLRTYFQAMIWIGRTEFYVEAPQGALPPPTTRDIQRQTIAAVLLNGALTAPAAQVMLDRIESTLRAFAGDQDNITPAQLAGYCTDVALTSPEALTDSAAWRTFQRGLLQRSFACQRINSQILWSDPMSPDTIRPAASYLMLGQRFVVDSYITGNVVYDHIAYQGVKVTRMLPSALDVLFALGNDAAGKLLGGELDRYHYASNLASLRYLIDGYEPAYWDSSLYTGWLKAIRSLAPPKDRSSFPPFMQTAAWWQKGMNTQLASWAQLRHDNLLYAKQSYSGGPTCSYPESYVEPVPAFYAAMRALAHQGAGRFATGLLAAKLPRVSSFFTRMVTTMDTLEAVAVKELAGTSRSDAEQSFLHRMIYQTILGCAPAADGWYARLYYGGEEALSTTDMVVADVHTAPADEAGALVGWVKHAGTGPVNLGVLVAPCSDGTPMTFVGPMASYYEHTTLGFKRLTDEEWSAQTVATTAMRPPWVNLYLADSKGAQRPEGPTLLTGVDGPAADERRPEGYVLAQNYPNPFNPSTVIAFGVPPGAAAATVSITIYDVRGARVRELLHMPLVPGSYSVRWDGTSDSGARMASGAFFYELRAGQFATTRSMLLLR